MTSLLRRQTNTKKLYKAGPVPSDPQVMPDLKASGGPLSCRTHQPQAASASGAAASAPHHTSSPRGSCLQAQAGRARKEAKRRGHKPSTPLPDAPSPALDPATAFEDPAWLDPWDDLPTDPPSTCQPAAALAAADSPPQLPQSALRAALADADVRQNFWRRYCSPCVCRPGLSQFVKG